MHVFKTINVLLCTFLVQTALADCNKTYLAEGIDSFQDKNFYLNTIKQSTVSIESDKTDGLTYACVGTLAKNPINNRVEVLTAKHCAEKSLVARVTFSNHQTTPVEYVQHIGSWSDFVFLQVKKIPSDMKGLPIAKQKMKTNDKVALIAPCSAFVDQVTSQVVGTVKGFGSVTSTGPTLRATQSLDFRPGKSGAGLINMKGELVGVGSTAFGDQTGKEGQFVDMVQARYLKEQNPVSLGTWSREYSLTDEGRFKASKDDIDNKRNISESISELLTLIDEIQKCGDKVQPQVYFQLGAAYRSIGKMDESIRYMSLGAGGLSSLADAHYALGEACYIKWYHEGRTDASLKARVISEFSLALSLEPNHRLATYWLNQIKQF